MNLLADEPPVPADGQGARPAGGAGVSWVHLMMDLSILSGLALLLYLDNQRWVSACSWWIYDDTPHHFHLLARQLTDPMHGEFPFWHAAYPPLLYWMSAAMARLVGLGHQTYLALEAGSILMLMLGVYALGRQMQGRGVGLLAAFLTFTSLPVLLYSRTLVPDLASAGLVALGLASLVRSRGFQHGGWGLLFGLALAAALLVRQTSAFFLGPALWWVLATSLVRSWGRARGVSAAALLAVVAGGLGAVFLRWVALPWVLLGACAVGLVLSVAASILGRGRIPQAWTPLRNSLLALSVSGGLFLPWYASNFWINAEYFTTRVVQKPTAPAAPVAVGWRLLQGVAFLKDILVGTPWFPFLLLGLVLVGAGWRRYRGVGVVLAALLPGALLVAWGTEAQARYFLPVSGLLFLLVAMGMLRWRVPGVLLSVLVVSAGGFQWLGWHGGAGWGRIPLTQFDRYQHFSMNKAWRAWSPWPLWGGPWVVSILPFSDAWELRGVLQALGPLVSSGSGPAEVLVLQPVPGSGSPPYVPLDAANLATLYYAEGGERVIRFHDLRGLETLDAATAGRRRLLVLTVPVGDMDPLEHELACQQSGWSLEEVGRWEQPLGQATALVLWRGRGAGGIACDG